MLNHLLKKYLLGEVNEVTKKHEGVCFHAQPDFLGVQEKTSKYSNMQTMKATDAWVRSTAVPSTLSLLYPVQHPLYAEWEDPETPYITSRAWGSMLTGEYGENRMQYAQFVYDYLEEAWK